MALPRVHSILASLQSHTQATGKNEMGDNRTASILQRVPVILKVTAASYGLSLLDRAERMRAAAAGHKGGGQRAAQREKTGRQR